MSEGRLHKLWWHQWDIDSLQSQPAFGHLRAAYDAHKTPEIAALGSSHFESKGAASISSTTFSVTTNRPPGAN